MAVHPKADEAVERAANFRGPLVAAVAIVLVFFGGFGAWAVLVPLSGAALAPAYVAPEGFRKTVQHLEGGIVAEIRVKEGSTVNAGDVIVVLDDTRAMADYNAATAQLASMLARSARLSAEESGAATPAFADDLLALGAQDAGVAALIGAERQNLVARRQALADQVAMRDGKVAQARADLASYEGSLTSVDRQIELIDEEIATVEDLLRKGLDRKPRLLALQRARADLDGQRNTAVNSALGTRELIGATQSERAALISSRAEEVATGLAESLSAANRLRAEVKAAGDRLERTRVRAPVAGEVVDLKLRTIGGVINPGEPLLDLVPRDQPLVIEARISPKDIDVVHPGLKADVHLTAFHMRNLTRVQGEVVQVSADRLTDPKTGEPYYTAQIYVDMAEVQKNSPELKLSPGMPAEAMIITGERTTFEYLIEPIRNSFRRSLRET
jgi:HlyD family secretion protein